MIILVSLCSLIVVAGASSLHRSFLGPSENDLRVARYVYGGSCGEERECASTLSYCSTEGTCRVYWYWWLIVAICIFLLISGVCSVLCCCLPCCCLYSWCAALGCCRVGSSIVLVAHSGYL